ncbi:MAG: hypothetical protein AB1776_06135 [Bacillota bacterium]
MAGRLNLFREMLAITRRMRAVAQTLSTLEAGEMEEDDAGIRELAELIQAREELMRAVDMCTEAADEEQEAMRVILEELRELDAELGEALEARRRNLAALLQKINEGKRALAYVRATGPGTGTVFDRKK